MAAPFRKIAGLVCFLLLLTALVASESDTIDQWILILVWTAFVVGSLILVIKNANLSPEHRGFHFGQLAVMPRSWRRWILDEPDRPNADDDQPTDKKRNATGQ